MSKWSTGTLVVQTNYFMLCVHVFENAIVFVSQYSTENPQPNCIVLRYVSMVGYSGTYLQMRCSEFHSIACKSAASSELSSSLSPSTFT